MPRPHVTVNHSRGEFGNALSTGLLLPYMYHNLGHPVKVISRVWFPKEVAEEWFGEYECGKREASPNELNVKQRMEKALVGDPNLLGHPEAIKSIPLPRFDPPTSEPYITLVPTVYGHFDQTFHARTVTAMTFREWKDIADTARLFGLKVAVFAAFDSISRDQIEELADFSFFATKKDIIPINHFFYEKQLPWMQNAQCNVSTGGACHSIFTFDLPGVIYDGQLYTNYRPWFWQLQKTREDLDVLPRENYAIWPADGHRYQYDMDARDRMQRYWGECFKFFMIQQLLGRGYIPQVESFEEAMNVVTPRLQVMDAIHYRVGKTHRSLMGLRDRKQLEGLPGTIQCVDRACTLLGRALITSRACRVLASEFQEAEWTERGLTALYAEATDQLNEAIHLCSDGMRDTISALAASADELSKTRERPSLETLQAVMGGCRDLVASN